MKTSRLLSCTDLRSRGLALLARGVTLGSPSKIFEVTVMPRMVVRGARKEERNPERLRVVLSRIAEPLFTETASTENVSSHGMRVLTDRLWKQGTELLVQSPNRELWGHGRVVYCQSYPHGTFATGLELLARTGDWINRSLTPQAPKWK